MTSDVRDLLIWKSHVDDNSTLLPLHRKRNRRIINHTFVLEIKMLIEINTNPYVQTKYYILRHTVWYSMVSLTKQTNYVF